MIIRENGAVVGKLDDKTLRLTESTSARLTELIEDWKKNGLYLLQAADGPLPEGAICACVDVNVPFEPKAIHIFEHQLLIAGFEVQPA